MRKRATFLARCVAAVSLAVAAAAGPAAADQDDPRLERLFDSLQTTSSDINAQGLTNAIWIVWLEHEDPRVVERMQSGMAALQDENYYLALAIYDDLVEQAPGYAEAWNKRATVHFLLGQYDRSLADIEKTLELEPRHFGALEGRGLIYGEMGLDEQALEAFERALEVNPHLPAATRRVQQLRGESERI
jgi:tetratricopeptide (TPR) repeat protein